MLASTPSTEHIVTALYIAMGVVGLLGASGLYGIYRLAKARGVQEDTQNRVAYAVLGSAGVPGVENQPGLIADVADIKRLISPNGRDTQNIGDIAARVESSVVALNKRTARSTRSVQRLAGANEEAHRQFRSDIKAIQERIPPAPS